MNREEALEIIQSNIKNQNIIKHMLAAEAVMRALATELSKRHPDPETSSGLSGSKSKILKPASRQDGQVQHDNGENFNEEQWGLVGLLHDGDYVEGVPENMQGIQISKWVEEKGFKLPEEVKQAMAAHNSATGVKPQSKMDWAIFTCDSLTGLIVAATLVLPSKKLADLTVESVLKRFKEPSFAKGTRREDIKACEENLGLSLPEFVKISLEAMQGIGSELGL